MLTLWQLRRQSHMQPERDNCTTLLLHRVLLKRQSPVQVDTKHCHMLSHRQIDTSDGHTRRMIGIVCFVSTFRRSEPPISGFTCVQVVPQSDVESSLHTANTDSPSTVLSARTHGSWVLSWFVENFTASPYNYWRIFCRPTGIIACCL